MHSHALRGNEKTRAWEREDAAKLSAKQLNIDADGAGGAS